jgi:two-component system, cell cycle response regulator DivK
MSEPMARILLVEDDAENRDALGRWLRRRGFDVLSAANGRTGVEMARSQRPDLILMDMEMPELSGWEATRQIRTEPNGAAAAIPVIALTAHAMTGDRERALAAGCSDYHPKPIELHTLLARIDAILSAAPPA